MKFRILSIALVCALLILTSITFIPGSNAQVRKFKGWDIGPALQPGDKVLCIQASAFEKHPFPTDYAKDYRLYVDGAGAAAEQYFYAPLLLPAKSRIQRMDIVAIDNGVGKQIGAFIDYHTTSGGAAQPLSLNTVSGGESPDVRVWNSTRINHKMPGSRFYNISVAFFGAPVAGELVFYGVRIIYK